MPDTVSGEWSKYDPYSHASYAVVERETGIKQINLLLQLGMGYQGDKLRIMVWQTKWLEVQEAELEGYLCKVRRHLSMKLTFKVKLPGWEGFIHEGE